MSTNLAGPEVPNRSTITRFDHVGVTVADLDGAIEFFTSLGLTVLGRTPLVGEFVDAVTGIPGCRTEIAMLGVPGGSTTVELSSFRQPAVTLGNPEAMANEAGLRSLAFEVADLRALTERLAADGYPLVGSIGEYENSWAMAYVRGPEGLLIALAQRLDA